MTAETAYDEAKTTAAFAELERLAREIDPNLPADLTGYEIRITLNKEFQSVELIEWETGIKSNRPT